METLPKDQMKALKVLLVDDDNFALRVVRHILYELDVGFIDEAFNGEGAKEKLNKQHFDLLISDVEMPKLNGLGLLKSVRCGETQAPRNLPTIIITSLASSEVIRTSLALDVNGFLAKPLRPVDVLEKISSALSEINTARPITDYKTIETDLKILRKTAIAPKKSVNAGIILDQAEETKQEVSQSADSNTDGNRMFIRELKPGMRISQNLYMKDSSLLLKEGYTLTETTINRLVELRDMLKDESVLIIPEESD